MKTKFPISIFQFPNSGDASRSTLKAPRSSSAFTLVELMVVVAVIAILIMIMAPNLRTMREKARATYCRNNLRQYGIAINQYMTDNNGFFIYPGLLHAGSGHDSASPGGREAFSGQYDLGVRVGAQYGGAWAHDWGKFIVEYLPATITLGSLSAGEASVRVCPSILSDLRGRGNYFDPRSPDHKGYSKFSHPELGELEISDFENYTANNNYDSSGNLLPETFLDKAFTTYALNIHQIRKAKQDIPANSIAFIDWNAREGWFSILGWRANGAAGPGPWWYSPSIRTNVWMFSSPDGTIRQGDKKWTDKWWISEVGFHHLNGREYGANYVAMDGHVGWISSNAISITNFTGP